MDPTKDVEKQLSCGRVTHIVMLHKTKATVPHEKGLSVGTPVRICIADCRQTGTENGMLAIRTQQCSAHQYSADDLIQC